MSALPAAQFLEEFSTQEAPALWAVPPAADEEAVSDAAKLEEAFARGLEEGRREALDAFEQKLDTQRSEFAQQLNDERAAWAASIGKSLGDQFIGAIAELESRIADSVARILKPFLTSELHCQAVAELRAALDSLLSTDPGIRIEITGPADVIEQLRRHLSGKAINVTYGESPDCDVKIVAGQSLIETQFKAWLAKLDEAVP